MGIPSYFSYLVKNYPDIIKKLVKNQMHIDNLYMDCNSIIYDCVRTIDFNAILNLNLNSREKYDSKTSLILSKVIQKIEEYIYLLSPTNNVMIAFDGVAPVAKLEQQRTRRYKSWYQNEISKSIYKKTTEDPWNTVAITPGTSFMKELSIEMKRYFSSPEKYKLKKLIVSTSDDYGEGEHKIFEYIRENETSHIDKSTIIYGLDADLIMLSINHLPISKQIYLFRETPEFIKSIDQSLEPNETYLLDIPELSNVIYMKMTGSEEVTVNDKNRIYDYIFMCFFLGNDFMPHFPALNIRTGGVDKLLYAYNETIGKTKETLTNGKIIYWKNVRKFVEFLANLETEYFQMEMKKRDKREKIRYPSDTPDHKYLKFESIPNYEREIEKYINPFKEGWRYRYYKSLFKVDIDEMRCKEICINYMQGLEWTMKYYTSGCPSWRWCYQHNYPPLLQDLVKYIPYFDTAFFKPTDVQKPVSSLVQLCYVLPRQSLHFLPEKLYKRLKEEYDHIYPTDCEFTWAFCKYFWESHVDLPEINVNHLENIVSQTLGLQV